LAISCSHPQQQRWCCWCCPLAPVAHENQGVMPNLIDFYIIEDVYLSHRTVAYTIRGIDGVLFYDAIMLREGMVFAAFARGPLAGCEACLGNQPQGGEII